MITVQIRGGLETESTGSRSQKSVSHGAALRSGRQKGAEAKSRGRKKTGRMPIMTKCVCVCVCVWKAEERAVRGQNGRRVLLSTLNISPVVHFDGAAVAQWDANRSCFVQNVQPIRRLYVVFVWCSCCL